MSCRKKIIFFLLISLFGIIVIVLLSKKLDSNSWNYCDFPNIDDTVIQEIREGHHTDFFDSTSVVYNFLNDRYPRCFEKISPKIINEDKAIYDVVISNEVEKGILRIELKKQQLTREDNYKIWKVIRYKIIES